MAEVLIGIISGIISGTGMGGGTILIFLLVFVCGIEQHIAQATNLIFFILSIIVNIKNKNINLKLATIISIFGILGAIIGANLAVHTNVKELRKYFGIFLFIIAVHEIYTIIKENKKLKIRQNK